MSFTPWYRVVTPRQEVREGRSFNPDEFAIHLEQVVAKRAPEDYRDPWKFFSRTCWTAALTEHVGMVLRRLSGQTANTAPVSMLITQFGGGKTHTLTALYHLVANRRECFDAPGVQELLRSAGLMQLPDARVAVFVGNAWDPQEGRETPWIDIARQLAGDRGVEALGQSATVTTPGTESLSRLFDAAGGRVLLLFDEVLNFLNRHRHMADNFHAFIQNLTSAVTGTTHSVAMISLPRSQVEMTNWDLEWQERITKVVRRVAKDLITNDEAEISEVVRRRLFEDVGGVRLRKRVAQDYAKWCFDNRAQLPPEWTAVDTATTEARAKEYLRSRFEASYPFHPATISVFQRKWRALPQYQETRGTLAMLAQWICWVYQEGYQQAKTERLITLGSAPLHVSGFRSVVLGQIGESRLQAAIEADITGQNSHARALDADKKESLRDIHRRIGTAIFFESSGGQAEPIAHLPELRFAIGGPDIETTSVDNAVSRLASRGFFIRTVGSDGFRIHYKAKIDKVANDRRASLDYDNDVLPALQDLIRSEFKRGAPVPVEFFPSNGGEVGDVPRLTVWVVDPSIEWTSNGPQRARLAQWTHEQRSGSSRRYPAALIWCIKKPGRELREKVEWWLAWRRVANEVEQGVLGVDYEQGDVTDIRAKVRDAEQSAKDEVWASYRYIAFADRRSNDGLAWKDLGAGHASASETLVGRVINALKSDARLNESVGAGYIERNWPPAFKEEGAWPLASLRQSFLDGSLTRLLDPDAVLRRKLVEFIERGEFGLASGREPNGTYKRIWFAEAVGCEEITFESDVWLLTRSKAELELEREKETSGPSTPTEPSPDEDVKIPPEATSDTGTGAQLRAASPHSATKIRLSGALPPEVWNRLGTRLIPKLRSGSDLEIQVSFSVTTDRASAASLQAELNQLLDDLDLSDRLRIQAEVDDTED